MGIIPHRSQFRGFIFRRIFESWPAVVVAEMAVSGCLNGLHEQVKLLDNVVFYEVESVGKV